MKRWLVPVLVCAVWGFSCGAKAGPVSPSLIERVKILTSPELAGRGAGSLGGHAAGDMVAGWFAERGLAPAFDGDWFQEFPLHGEGWSGQPLTGKRGRNVAGILPGRGILATRYVLVSAHYDHLGRSDGDTTSRSPDADAYFPGANDNASGVTTLVAIAEGFGTLVPDSGNIRSVLFVSFDGEEVGLQGSAYLVDHMPVPLDSLDAVINMDTVGQMGQGKLYVSGIGSTPSFAAMASEAGVEGLELSLADGGWAGSDHMTFNDRQIPALFIFGGPYPQYNRPADRWDTLDLSALDAVADYTGRLLALVARYPGPMSWVKVSNPALLGTGEGNHNTWLGTMPDFTDGVVGYMIGGVFDGSPAQSAGLAKGDVVTQFGGQEVVDLGTFTRALRSFGPGEPVEIILLRDGRSLKFTLVLGDRSQRR